jgi:asparagine synthase (glutamine-hydrolysing)
MCGILGHVSRAAGEREPLQLALACLTHRGPDDTGTWWSPDERVALGHQRLAIIDLSPGGHQPMADPSGRCTLVFNGEIYNYRDLRAELMAKGYCFRTASDTEVILAAYLEWGTACVERLNGQFAIALYDRARGSLFIARDRAGEKPLFYLLADSALSFASELKALLASAEFPRTIDRAALDCYLAMGYVPGERSILSGVSKLPPAHAMTFDVDTGSTRVWRYWGLPEFDEQDDSSEDALLHDLEALLENAVARQLVADVPVGILLSGGVDSSLITALAVRSAPDVRTFTVTFPGFGDLDETEHARLIARHFGTTHIELEGAPTRNMLPTLARQFDEPMADSSMIPTYLVSRLVREHCTVALGGDGGDELFGGYPHYARLLRLEQVARLVPRPLRALAAASGSAVLPVGFKGRNWLRALGADFRSDVPPVQWLFDLRTRRRLMASHDWEGVAEAIHAERVPGTGDLLQRATRMDFENYLAEDILVKVDRASMLTSLEMRAPFLDYRVIEFAFRRVSSSQKASVHGLKHLLKRLCGRLLPPEFDQKRKQGFIVPLSTWLQSGPLANVVAEILLDDDSIFDRSTVQALIRGQNRGLDNGERLFALALFELWRREYRLTLA